MLSKISSILDGRLVEIDVCDSYPAPTTTLLQYLRCLPNHSGTKEGCAEGDCGACTVVLCETDSHGNLRYRSVDSCLLLLPMIHGKQVITVENLSDEHGKPHPVQQAMVDTGGSQCGYCTPGFVMSLFSLSKNHDSPTRDAIADAITGNLCRCTGYQPIVDAAARASSQPSISVSSHREEEVRKILLSLPRGSLLLENTSQRYHRPLTLSEAITLKHQLPQALILSGATDVALRLTKGHELLREIIDLSGIEELKKFKDTDVACVIGAGLALSDVMPRIRNSLPALFDMLTVFGSQQIRNVATLGGNLGTASPIGDTLPVLIAYHASVVLERLDGRREIPIDEYFTGYRQTVCRRDEIISSIIIPKPRRGAAIKAYKISKRKDLDISSLSAVFNLELDRHRNVKSIVVAYGGMAERPIRALGVERFLEGKEWQRTTIDQSMPILEKEFSPISDVRASAGFRTIAAKNLLLKFWAETYAS